MAEKSNYPTKPHMDTSQRIRHVYACNGTPLHVTSGFQLLQTNSLRCPYCGAEVSDITKTPLGQAYFAFARPDLGVQQ